MILMLVKNGEWLEIENMVTEILVQTSIMGNETTIVEVANMGDNDNLVDATVNDVAIETEVTKKVETETNSSNNAESEAIVVVSDEVGAALEYSKQLDAEVAIAEAELRKAYDDLERARQALNEAKA